MAEDSDPFESAWLKWAWAKAHAHGLESHVTEWRKDPDRKSGVGFGKRYNPKRHCIEVFITEIEPFPIEWGLALGDIAHNYRSCLDHIAWALVERGKRPPLTLKARQRSSIYFPICKERTDFNGSYPVKLPGVGRTEIAVVRRYQPYTQGKRKRDLHAFAILARISKDDKHRAVQPVAGFMQAASYKITKQHNCVVTKTSGLFRADVLKVGAQLAPIYVRKIRKGGSEPDVDMQGSFAASPILKELVWVGDWLTETERFVASLLRELSDPPTKLLKKLGIL